jgi:precorrin-6y C5,15-methyltransferase (decarboxylating) CbiE subunit
MDTLKPPIVVVGCGPGAPECLTREAEEAIAAGEVIVGSRRLLDAFAPSAREWHAVVAEVEAALDGIEAAGDQRVVVLVSGDTGLRSLARCVVARFGRHRCRLIPGISSVQVACARLGLEWTALRVVTAHGETPDAEPDELARCDAVAVLAGGVATWPWIAALVTRLADSHRAFLCENLTLPEERVSELSAATVAGLVPASLSLAVLARRSLLA